MVIKHLAIDYKPVTYQLYVEHFTVIDRTIYS
jgi:hypothetical protein